MNCPECGAEIVYLDNWYKKCSNGHVTPSLRSEVGEWRHAHKKESAV